MRNLVLFTSMILSFWGCSNDKDFGGLENIGWNEKPLQITTRILTTKSTNFIQEFKEGSMLGLQITSGTVDDLYNGISTYKNVSVKAYRVNGKIRWQQSPEVILDSEVNRKSPLAKLSMNYALSLLSFEIYQDSDINGLFKLTSIQIGNRAGGNTLQYTGTMDIVTGNIKGTPGAYKATLLTIDPSVTLRHAKAEEQNIRIVPTYSPIREKEVEAIFTINGRTYKYIIPEGTCWNKGYKYSYKLYFDGKDIRLHDSVAYIWTPKLKKK